MTCWELVEFLMDYLDGQLAEPERLRFEDHLGECPDCAAYLATYREAVRLGKEACTAGDTSIPPEVPEDLVRAVLAARRKEAFRKRRTTPPCNPEAGSGIQGRDGIASEEAGG